MNNERKKVGMLLPPPIIFLAASLFCLIGHYIWVGSFTIAVLPGLFGVLLLIASIFIIIASEKEFRLANTPVRPSSPTIKIVDTGIYRYTRNPMYFGMTGMLISTGLLFNSLCFFITALPVLLTIHVAVVLPEERYLMTLHGEVYAEYMWRVPRWIW